VIGVQVQTPSRGLLRRFVNLARNPEAIRKLMLGYPMHTQYFTDASKQNYALLRKLAVRVAADLAQTEKKLIFVGAVL
jgi:hypothetical protein